jgi:hypothetical protein
MIVPAMTRSEIEAEIKKDLAKIYKSTIPRLAMEYDRERRKLKFDKSEDHKKIYSIKTGSKNSWMFFVKKATGKTKYKEISDATFFSVVHYYTKEGLNACRVLNETDDLQFFYGHFFTRYNERQQLNLPDTLSALKHFFSNNEGFQTIYSHIKKEKAPAGTMFVESVCEQGLAFGLHYIGNHHTIYKTFISKHLLTKTQRTVEESLNQEYADEAIDNNDEALNNVAA